MLRPTTFGIVSATTTAPWPRMRAAGLSARAFASARPSATVSTSMLVMPPASRISKTGTPAARNALWWYIGRSGTFLSRSLAPESVTAADILEYGLAIEPVLQDVGRRHRFRREGSREEEAILVPRRADADMTVAVDDAFRREDVIGGDEIADEIVQIGRGLRQDANLRQQCEYSERQQLAAVHSHIAQSIPLKPDATSSSGFKNVPSGARLISLSATIASRLSGP